MRCGLRRFFSVQFTLPWVVGSIRTLCLSRILRTNRREERSLLPYSLVHFLAASGRKNELILTHALNCLLFRSLSIRLSFAMRGGCCRDRPMSVDGESWLWSFRKFSGWILLVLKNLGFKRNSGECPRSVCEMMVVFGVLWEGCGYLLWEMNPGRIFEWYFLVWRGSQRVLGIWGFILLSGVHGEWPIYEVGKLNMGFPMLP